MTKKITIKEIKKEADKLNREELLDDLVETYRGLRKEASKSNKKLKEFEKKPAVDPNINKISTDSNYDTTTSTNW